MIHLYRGSASTYARSFQAGDVRVMLIHALRVFSKFRDVH